MSDDFVGIQKRKITMQGSQKPNILFFSSKCKYSNEVVNLIEELRIIELFVMVNIDKGNYQLPPFVDRTPLIFIRKQAEVVIDDNIPHYLRTLVKKVQQQQSAQQSAGDMLSLSDISRGISDNYSFIGGDQLAPKNFAFVDERNLGGSEPAKTSSDSSSRKASKFNPDVYEQYMAQRDTDVVSMFPGQAKQRI